MDQNKLTETLAVNTGNMIASLNLQVAKLQTAHEEQDEEITKLKAENDKLKIENQALKKEVMKHEPSADHIDHQQNRK
ncbi:hypothetical protein [Lactobacillus helveticus]|uniref:hypothetical protein n=1 Tax=Lactobacillus helveticus TaxID=1587 RepID=UPI0013FD72B5|nr:hypothetical protein [Lactobacillus helveticus]NHL94361.1 hypothetical protein [Lactobacillus helveticus]